MLKTILSTSDVLVVPSHRRLAFLLVGGFLALTALNTTAHAQPADIFGERVDVRVVNLEVVVEDEQGRRVHGLERDDFRVLVDGREAPVGFFSEVRGGQTGVSDSGRNDGSTPGRPGDSQPKPVGTSYLVFVDNFFSIHRDRNIVLDNLLDSLDVLRPGDQMAVVGFDGRKLELFSGWSGSRDDLREALQRAREADTVGLGVRDQVRSMPGSMPIESMKRKLKRVSLGVMSALRSFSNARGRKVALVLSGGWPQNLMQQGVVPGEFGGPVIFGADALRPMYETANLLGFTLYPIGLPTFPGIPGFSAENGSPASRVASPIGGRREVDGTLRTLARQTGGQALGGDARREALGRVVEDLDSYYWFGLTPNWRGDDRTHSIEVVPLRPGLTVRHRTGFRDLSREQEVSILVESALLFGELPDAEPLDVQLGERRRSGFRKAQVPVELRIPMDAVTMIPHQGQYVAQMELRVAALDKDGDRNEMQVVPVEIKGPRRPVPGQYAIYEAAIELRRQRHDLVISLHDPLSGGILASVVEYRP